MEYRRLNPKDIDSYFSNRLRALKNSPNAFLSTYEEEVSIGNSHFLKTLENSGEANLIFGAIDNGAVVGTIGIYQEDRPKLKHKAQIWGMYVDEAFRKTGVGKRLLDLAIDHAKLKMKVDGIYLSLEADNYSARSLYESRGFKCWGTEPKAMKLDGHFFDEHHMALMF